VHLGERDCTIQRRHQKLVEETPSPAVGEELRERIGAIAVEAARAVGYRSAGTIEGLLTTDGSYYFLEMNTRVQVEHTVTEVVTGIDIVREQVLIGAGEPLAVAQAEVVLRGHAIECRINAESPQHGFRPCPGWITDWRAPSGTGIRVDSHCYLGYFVPPYYDSLLAKLIVHGADRDDAINKTRQALASFQVAGIDTGIPFLQTVIDDQEYRSGNVNTRWLEKKLLEYSPAEVQG
jgi:acetyl-CoA carboxylase, biotin carboxylase subunit